MNIDNQKYTDYALCREMFETVEVIGQVREKQFSFDFQQLNAGKNILITGEGSSRLIPAKNAIYQNMRHGCKANIFTEGATQALEYPMHDMTVMGLSNSGRTKELIRLFDHLKEANHSALIGITANESTLLEEKATATIQLICGKENAVAATKSVVEQALIVEKLLQPITGTSPIDYQKLAAEFHQVLSGTIDPTIIDALVHAETIYFSGRNTGIAEELTIKTNEIIRKKSDFLEGTYAVHGIEEVMTSKDAIILLDPFPAEEQLFHDLFVDKLGMKVIAIASKETLFQTIIIPHSDVYGNYLKLAAGWNLLVETGLTLNVDIDKPERARKIGNEFIKQPQLV